MTSWNAVPSRMQVEQGGNVAASYNETDSTTRLYPPSGSPSITQAKSSRSQTKAWLAFMGMCALLGYALGKTFRGVIDSSVFVVLVGFVLSVWPHVIVHEAGHALAGLIRGMRAIAFGIGPFRFERGVEGWHARRGQGIQGISGFAHLIPANGRGSTRADQAWYLLGGPLANLTTAGICLAVVLSLAPDQSMWAGLLLGTSVSALLLGLANLLPFKSHGWRSDGRNLIDLLLKRPDASLQMRITQLVAVSALGVRPRDWPIELMPASPESGVDPMLAASSEMLRLAHAVDIGDETMSESCALSAVSQFGKLPRIAQAHMATGIACYVALMRRDPALLAAWLPLCQEGMTDLSAFQDWLHAEHAALTGRTEQARAAMHRAEAAAGRVHDAASVMLLREYLTALRARLAAVDAPSGS